MRVAVLVVGAASSTVDLPGRLWPTTCEGAWLETLAGTCTTIPASRLGAPMVVRNGPIECGSLALAR